MFQIGRSFSRSSLDYGGNLELIPPADTKGLGKIVIGIDASPQLKSLLASQKVQMPFPSSGNVTTSWLGVGHVDEAIAFTQDPNRILVASPAKAFGLMDAISEADRGKAVFFAGGANLPVSGIVPAADSDLNILRTARDHRSEGTWENGFVRIYKGGDRKGQVAWIQSITADSIVISQCWDASSTILDGAANSTHSYARYFEDGFRPNPPDADNYRTTGWIPMNTSTKSIG